MDPAMRRDRALRRFLDRLDRTGGPDACWPFVGARSNKGYGRLSFQGKVQTASRVAYMLLVGPIPDGLWVLHHCDNPPCCNPGPKHLFTGTGFDNMRDAAAKARLAQQQPDRTLRGERVGTARLTEPVVLAIRAMRADGATQAAISTRFGVPPTTVGMIVRRDSWTHVA